MPTFITKQVIRTLRLGGVKKAALFGSFARGEEKKNSDVDLLIQFSGQKSLLDMVRLKLALEHEVHRKVDLVTYDSLHPSLRKRILEEQEVIYEKRS